MLSKGGMIVSLGGSSTPSFTSTDSGDSKIHWETAEETPVYFVKVKLSTTLLRDDDTMEDQVMYTREARTVAN